MNRSRIACYVAIATALLLMLSCAGGTDPVNPNIHTTPTAHASATPGHILWGMFQISIDKSTGDVDIVPLRGPAFNVNVTQFLHPPFSPVHMMLTEFLPSSDLAGGYVEVDVTLNHPFPGLNQCKGFDVRGIFMADGSHAGIHDTDIIYGDADLNEAYLLNPDGYTRWWNATEFTDPMPLLSFKPGKMGNDPSPSATLNPYKYYADDIEYDGDVAEMITSNRGVFSPDGPTHKRLYQIQFPVEDDTPQFLFNYAIDASWNKPDPSGAPDFEIDSFGPGAQCQEAYHLSVNTNDTTAWYEGGDSGGDVHIELEVFDWQGAVNSTGVPGELSAIRVESPALASPIDILTLAVASPGTQATSSVFDVDLDETYFNITESGDFPMMLSVESASPDSYQPQLVGGENFIFPDGPLAAYIFCSFHVDDEQSFVPADDVTGDVTLAVERDGSLGITGLTLDWTDNGSPFYAIYTDDNPYDGMDPDIFVMEVPSNTALIDTTAWPDFSTNGAYVFGVKGRTVSGLPASDSPNISQLAFVDMEDFDGGTNPVPWIQGYREIDYKWEEQTPGQIDASTSIRHNPTCPALQWAVLASDIIPPVADSAMAFIEFAHISSFISSDAIYKAYMAGHTRTGLAPPIGTSTFVEFDNWDYTSVIDGTFNYDNPEPGTGLIALNNAFGYELPNIERGWKFNHGPHGTAALTRISKPYFINHAGDTRAGVGWGRSQYHIYNTDWAEIDEIAVVIH